MQPAAVQPETPVTGLPSAIAARKYVSHLKVDQTAGQLLTDISSMDGVVAQMPTAAKVARLVSASALKALLLDRSVPLQRLRPAVARLLLLLDLHQVYLSQSTRDADYPLEVKPVWGAAGVTVALSITGVAQPKVCFYSTGEDASKQIRPLCGEYMPERLWEV
jgi:hypothetical protein